MNLKQYCIIINILRNNYSNDIKKLNIEKCEEDIIVLINGLKEMCVIKNNINENNIRIRMNKVYKRDNEIRTAIIKKMTLLKYINIFIVILIQNLV